MKKFFLCIVLVLLVPLQVLAREKIMITDMAGRRVTLPEKVESLVALHASLRYVVYLQAFDRVVGIEGLEKQKMMRGNYGVGKVYWLTIADRVHRIPSVGEGGPGKLPDFEKLISLKPEVIFTFEAESAELIQRKTGIPVVVLAYAGTEGFKMEEVMKTLHFMGKILGKEKRAEELNSYIDGAIKDLCKRTKNSCKPKVYVGAISARGNHGVTSTEAHYPPLQWINVENVVDEMGLKGHVFIDREKLMAWEPDYLFIDTGGLSLVNEDYMKNKEFYHRLKAIRYGKVYTIFPYNFYRTNVEILMANAYFMGKITHPERFKDISIEKKAREILKNFLEVDVFDALKQIYRGYGKVEFTDGGLIVR
jgi:iron complex transport system substrate-binding protein